MTLQKEIRTLSRNSELVSEKRRQIVDTAAKLFLQRGYEKTSTRELSDALGMSKGALYNYIGTKSDILYLLLQFGTEADRNLITWMGKQLDGFSFTEALKESIRIFYSHVNEMQDMYNFVNNTLVDLSGEDRRMLFASVIRMVDYFRDLLERGMQNGEFKIRDPRIVAHNIVVDGHAWANRRWYLRRHFNLDEYIAYQIEYVLKAVS